MRKSTVLLTTMIVAAGLVFSTAASFAGGACCANKDKATKVSMDGASCPTGASSASRCTSSAMKALFKDAPGTKTEFVQVDGGMAMVVTAASDEYVPVVQTAMMKHLDAMKSMSAEKAACATKASADHCASMKTEKASAGTCPMGGASATKASGASCATAHGAKVEQASAMECPEWMKVLCGASCDVQKTANGVRIVWTASKPEMVDQLRAAGEKLQADLSQS